MHTEKLNGAIFHCHQLQSMGVGKEDFDSRTTYSTANDWKLISFCMCDAGPLYLESFFDLQNSFERYLLFNEATAEIYNALW